MSPSELLLPRTDAGALTQAVVAAVFFSFAVAMTWRHRELRILVLGLAVITFGFFGLRMLH